VRRRVGSFAFETSLFEGVIHGWTAEFRLCRNIVACSKGEAAKIKDRWSRQARTVLVRAEAAPTGKGENMKRFSVAVLFVVVLLITASVAGAAASKPKLSFVKTNAQIGWSTDVGSSPSGGVSNTNNQSIKINATGPQGNSGASAYTYGSDETLVGIVGLKLSQIDHLGFDSKGYLGAGAPRISLGTSGTDGTHTYFLSALYCNTATSNGWRTSNFVSGGAGCTVFRDGVQMSWATAVGLADANNETVGPSPNDWFLIVDEAPSLTYVDRLSVQNWCWTGNGNNGIINRNSGDCI